MAKYHDDDMLTTTQCSAETHHHRRTILNWIHEGKLAARRSPSKRGKYLIRYKDLQECLLDAE